MTAQEIRELDTEALLAKVEEYKKELFGLRFQQATGQLENTARIRQVRKTIARITTVKRERELNQYEEIQMERKNRKVYTGTVVSTKMDKTITVLVETHVKHKLYGKRMKSSTKFHAHDENNTAQVGDTVKIMSTRPLSATKRFRLVEIVKKAETV